MLHPLLKYTAAFLLTGLLAACVPAVGPSAPAAEEPAAAVEEPAAESAAAANEHLTNVVYDLPDLGGLEVSAAVANDYTPLQFIDATSGEAMGWEYDAMAEICRRLNCTVNWVNTSWDAMIPAVVDGQVDIGMDGITINDERKQQVDFSVPYMTSQQFMLTRAGEDRFAGKEEFAANADLLVGAQPGTSNFYAAVYDVLDGDEANPRIQLYESFGASVQALIIGDVDMVLVDAASGRGYIGANPDALQIVGDAIKSEEFGFIFPKGSELNAAISAAIESMQSDGYTDYLDSKWFFLTDPNGPDLYDSLPDLGGQEIAAAVANDYTPFQFVDAGAGVAVGWEYDAMEEICRRLNCTIDWVSTSWDAMIPAVVDGQVDIGMDGITINDERKEQVDFSAPYINSQQFMLTRAGEERFASKEEFAANADLLVGAQPGTSNFYAAVYDVLDGDEANPRIQLYESFGASVQALIIGDVDMVLVDAASGRGYIGANPDALQIVGDAIKSEEFGFIFQKGSELVAPIDAAIASLQQDGYFDHLNSKWFFFYNPN